MHTPQHRNPSLCPVIHKHTSVGMKTNKCTLTQTHTCSVFEKNKLHCTADKTVLQCPWLTMTNGCNMQNLNKLLLGTKQEKDCFRYHFGMRLCSPVSQLRWAELRLMACVKIKKYVPDCVRCISICVCETATKRKTDTDNIFHLFTVDKNQWVCYIIALYLSPCISWGCNLQMHINYLNMLSKEMQIISEFVLVIFNSVSIPVSQSFSFNTIYSCR